MALSNRAIIALCAAVGLGGGVAVGNAIVWQRERSRASKQQQQLLEDEDAGEEAAPAESPSPAPDGGPEAAPARDDPPAPAKGSETAPTADEGDPKLKKLVTLAGSMLQLVSDRSASRKVFRECIQVFRDLRQSPEAGAVAETLVPAQARLTQLVEYELPPLVKKDQAASLQALSSEFLEVVKQLVQEIMNDASLHLTSAPPAN